MKKAQWKMQTEMTELYLVASDAGLQGVHWAEQEVPMALSLEGDAPVLRILAQAVAELDQYFKGERQGFEVPLDMKGTDFQKKVWQALLEIPYGQTLSYKQLAQKLENEKAIRAVGTANGRNPLCIIVPCHRVIASDGSLGGYSGGLRVKADLLKRESL